MTISALHRVFYFKQFAECLRAAFPLSQALTLIHQNQEHVYFKKILPALLSQLNEGKSLSQAAQHHPALFSTYAQEMIHLGEQTGALDQCLTTLANALETEHALTQQIKNALFYPCLLFIVSSLFIFGLLVGVVPPFEKIFQHTPTPLPLFTSALFWLSHHCWAFLSCFILIISLFCLWQKKINALPLTAIFSKLPVIHSFWQRYQLLQCLNALIHALKAGLPIDAALKLSGHVTQAPRLQSALRDLRLQLHQGIPLYRAMQTHACFQASLLPFIQTGEATGQLESMITFAHLHLHAQWQHQLLKRSRLLEPLILLIQGALIGGVVIGLYLPIFNLGTLL
jgi:type II secretory pathway component PulF